MTDLENKIKEIIKSNNSRGMKRYKLQELHITPDEWYHLKLKFKYAYIINTCCYGCRYRCGKRIQDFYFNYENQHLYIGCDEFEWD